MSALSGKKYSAQKVRDFLPEYATNELTTNIAGNPRSVKKYLPVRISTAFLDNTLSSRKSNSNRKTLGLSTTQPIRNLHLLLESPKRNARKRLDNLYDTKPKENVVLPRVKPHVFSAKKLAPKTPIIASNISNKTNAKTPTIKYSQKSRQSRLLPPGTISGSYVNSRNSLAPRTSIYKPTNYINSQTKRPSDVPEESPQPLESSPNLSDGISKLSSINNDDKKSVAISEKNDITKETNIPLHDPRDKKDKSSNCCRCSEVINESTSPVNESKPDLKRMIGSREIDKQDLTTERERNEDDCVIQRPTVIVTQDKAVSQIIVADFEKLRQVDIQDGSYSEILCTPYANNSKIDESLLFKHTENACSRLESIAALNCVEKMTENIFKIISTSNEMLTKHRTQLTKSISQHEENIKSMKLMLEGVNTQLDQQKKLESRMKLKGLSDFSAEELSLIFDRDADLGGIKSPETSGYCTASIKENVGSSKGRGRPKGSKQTKARKSNNCLEVPEKGEQNNDAAGNVLKELNQNEIEMKNLENEQPQRRRSARLASKSAEFLSPLEKSTPALPKQKLQAKSKPCTPSMNTPARSVKWGRRSERPLREYMVLKSAIKFLKTPDSKRYQIGSDEKVKIPESLDNSQNAMLTDKLLKEFHELYATP